MGSKWIKSTWTEYECEETGYKVKFEEWHSDYLDEDFVGVSVFTPDGMELMHSGMSKLFPCEEQADLVLSSAIAVHDLVFGDDKNETE